MPQPEPLDSGDIDAISEMERSRGYELVADRIRQELERKRSELEKPLDLEGTATRRGAISALRTVLSIPGILRAEIAGALKD